MKTFKQLISEVQEPLSQGETNFKGLHNPINHKDLVPGVTDQDHVFNGTPQRKDPKTASYEDKASEKAYDQTLKIKNSEEKKKGSQTDLNIEEKHLTPAEMKKREEVAKAIARENPSMPMSKKMAIATATAKKVAEESEQIDELSKKTLGSYINKAASSAAKSSYKIMKDKPENAAKHGMDSFKRLEGIKKATAKMAEESEQIDEVSSKTVMSYGIKATAEIGKGNLSTDKESKRMAGIKMADEKMRKKEGKSSSAKIAAEEVEHLDEISKKTAYAAYAGKANDDYSKDYGEKLHGMIKKKWGKKAGDDAESHASAQHFGRGGKSRGTDRLSGIWNTAASSMRTTKSGKINKQDTKAKGNEIKSRLGSHTKAKLPEEIDYINEEDRDAHFEKQSKKMQDAINLHLRRGKSYDEAVKAAKKHVKEEQDLEEARRGRPRKDGSKPAGDEEGGREHIIVQLRKVVNLRGQKHVEFNDNSKHEVGVDHAKKALSMHDNLKRAEDKQNLANQLAKSHSSFKSALAGKMEAPKKKGISLAGMKNEAVERRFQDVDPEQGSADSTTMRSDRGAMKTYTTIGKDGRVKLIKHLSHAKEVNIGESMEMNPKNAKKMIKHDCAKHVLHKEWGEGETVEGMHTIVETSESEGYVTHYDVMFEHGIVQNVPVEDLEIITMVEHMHDNKKSKMEGKEHTVPKSAKEKDLAALAEPKDKITHKDVLVGRGVIKKAVKEAVNMQKDSLVKLKKDPAAGDNIKTDLPPTQGNKPIGGEGDPSRVGGKYSMEEEKLLKLYDSLSEENKSVFEALIESENGVEKLLAFAEEQGF